MYRRGLTTLAPQLPRILDVPGGEAPPNWTTKAVCRDRTPVLYLTWYLGTFHQNFTTAYSITYLKEFKSYVMTGITYGTP